MRSSSNIASQTIAAAVPGSPSAEELPRFERLLAELSAEFINLRAAHIDGAITDALRRIVGLLGVDRGVLISVQGDEALATHSWAVEGVSSVPRKLVTSRYPWVWRCILANKPVVVPRVGDLPPEAAVDRASWQTVGVRSNLTMPMRVGGQIEGALAFGCLRHEREWPEDLVERVRVLADVFANALAHKRAQEGLDAAIAFERLVSEILAALLMAGRGERDRVIDSALCDMAQAFGAERATLWQRHGDGSEFVKTHRWLAEGVPVPSASMSAVSIPWLSAELVAGSVVRFARHADLPPNAAADLPALRALQISAAVIVPLAVSGSVVGALSFAAAREEHDWPDALVPRVQLVGEVLAAMLAREGAERREREAQAQAAHAARVGTMGVLAASLVHELTQPLAASLANAQTAAELLAQALPDLAELRATVSDIVADDRRIIELIQQLRRFLRRGDVERSNLDLGDVVDEILRLAGSGAAEKGVLVTVDIPPRLPKLVGDRVQIQQVLLNLLLNAIDAAGASESKPGRVSVVARPSDSGVSVEVTDTGPGMDEQTLARIFQPFFTTKPGGMGLGLAISRSIVAAHGGTLEVRSTPGRGTTFRIELPLQPPGEVRPAPPSATPASGAATVFVVDDDPSMRRALGRQLAGAGYTVEAFASAQDYLDRAPQAGAACIVSDVRMPGLSGLDLQASLARANRDRPMVFISGHGDVPTTALAMKAGAINFLAKPFTKDELLVSVADALARSRELDAARKERAELQVRYRSLTPREREVFALVTAGLLNKVIADRLDAAETTIKIHRGRVMEKMRAASVADLVRMAEHLGVQSPDSTRRTRRA